VFGALKHDFRSLATLKLAVNFVGEINFKPKRTTAASRFFLESARLSCYIFAHWPRWQWSFCTFCGVLMNSICLYCVTFLAVFDGRQRWRIKCGKRRRHTKPTPLLGLLYCLGPKTVGNGTDGRIQCRCGHLLFDSIFVAQVRNRTNRYLSPLRNIASALRPSIKVYAIRQLTATGDS